MAGNSQRRGATRKAGSKKGASVGSGGQRRRGLEGKGPTPKAEERSYHPAAKKKAAAERRAVAGTRGAGNRPAGRGGGPPSGVFSDNSDIGIRLKPGQRLGGGLVNGRVGQGQLGAGAQLVAAALIAAAIVIRWLTIAILGAAILVGLFRVATAPDAASRAVVGDLVFFSAIGIIAVIGLVNESAASVDATLIASVLGILATVALARILTRGRR